MACPAVVPPDEDALDALLRVRRATVEKLERDIVETNTAIAAKDARRNALLDESPSAVCVVQLSDELVLMYKVLLAQTEQLGDARRQLAEFEKPLLQRLQVDRARAAPHTQRGAFPQACTRCGSGAGGCGRLRYLYSGHFVRGRRLQVQWSAR